MKNSIKLFTLLLTLMLLDGCGGDDATSDTSSTGTQKEKADDGEAASKDEKDVEESLYEWLFGDADEVEAEDALNSELIDLANSATDVNDFTLKGMKLTVEYVVNEYFSIADGYFLDDQDWGDNNDQYLYESLAESSETLVGYFAEFYNDTISGNEPAAAPARAASTDDQSLIEKIIDEIYNILAELLTSFFSFGDDVISVDTNYTGALIDPNQNFSFDSADLEGAEYFVASEQYMTVTFEQDGLSGYGDIGYGVGASFVSYVDSGKLIIDMDGVYEVRMVYKDPGYCYVTEMTDKSNGSTYPAYFFLDEAAYDKASSVSAAKSLC